PRNNWQNDRRLEICARPRKEAAELEGPGPRPRCRHKNAPVSFSDTAHGSPAPAGLLFFTIRGAVWNLMAKEHRNAGITQRVWHRDGKKFVATTQLFVATTQLKEAVHETPTAFDQCGSRPGAEPVARFRAGPARPRCEPRSSQPASATAGSEVHPRRAQQQERARCAG